MRRSMKLSQTRPRTVFARYSASSLAGLHDRLLQHPKQKNCCSLWTVNNRMVPSMKRFFRGNLCSINTYPPTLHPPAPAHIHLGCSPFPPGDSLCHRCHRCRSYWCGLLVPPLAYGCPFFQVFVLVGKRPTLLASSRMSCFKLVIFVVSQMYTYGMLNTSFSTHHQRSCSCRWWNGANGGAVVGAEGQPGQEREKQLLLRSRKVRPPCCGPHKISFVIGAKI